MLEFRQASRWLSGWASSVSESPRGRFGWDVGHPPQLLIDFLEENPPGRAIDLGCGTGTNAIAMAEYGWQVWGIDFVPEAIRLGKKKAKKAGVDIDLRVGDVTKSNILKDQFDLAIDIGCYHSLSPNSRSLYRENLANILTPGGIFLIYGHDRPVEQKPPGMTEADIEAFGNHMDLITREDASSYRGRPSFWLQYRK